MTTTVIELREIELTTEDFEDRICTECDQVIMDSEDQAVLWESIQRDTDLQDVVEHYIDDGMEDVDDMQDRFEHESSVEHEYRLGELTNAHRLHCPSA